MKVVLGSRGMTVAGARQWEGVESLGAYVDDCVSHGYFCLGPGFFRTTLPCYGGLSPGEGWDVAT